MGAGTKPILLDKAVYLPTPTPSIPAEVLPLLVDLLGLVGEAPVDGLAWLPTSVRTFPDMGTRVAGFFFSEEGR